MAENRKIQLEAEVTADTSGLDQIAEAAQGMAAAVQGAGQQAAQGLNAVSQAAAPAAQGLDTAQRRMQASIQRTMAAMQAGERGTASYFEAISRSRNIDTAPFDAYIGQLRQLETAQKASQQAARDAARADAFIAGLRQQADAVGRTRSEILELQAAQMGLGNQAAPYIQRLRQLEQGQTAVGMSARATAAAMRTIPAQLQDIAVSIQGGMNPLTVLSQQGSQLATVFGGVGPAIRGVGAYVLGLVNPFTVGAAVVGAFAVAAHQGSEEMRAFQTAATMSGNAIGVSASQFSAMRDSLSGIAGSRGKAAEVLTEIARNGQLAGGSIRQIAEAAIFMERATGQAIAKTVAQFAELAKSPTEAAAKLNQEFNFLTTAVYRQIKALEDQGRATDAARLAEQTYADALKQRAQSVVDNAGFMERAWHGITSAAKGAWDAMLNVGRAQTPAQALAAASADVARIQAQIAGVGTFATTGGGAAVGGASASRRAALEQDLASAKEVLAAAQRRVEVEQRNTTEKAEQARLEQLGIDFTKQGDQFLSRKQQREKELTRARTEGQALVNAGIITEAQLTARLNDIRDKFKDPAGPKARKIGADAFESQALREYSGALDAFQRIAGAAAAKSDDLSKSQEKLRELQASPVWASYSRQQQEQIIFAASLSQAEEDRADAVRASEQAHKEFAQAIVAAERASAQNTATLEQSALAAERELEQYGLLKSQVQQLTLARLEDMRAAAAAGGEDLEQIDRRIAAQGRLIAATQGIEAKDTAKKAADEAAREWKRTADSIEQSLTDALLRGFESGKDFAGNLRDTLKNMFSTMVLRPVVQAIMQPVTGTLAGIGQAFGSSGLSAIGGSFGGVPPNPFASGGAGGGLSALGNLAGIGSMFGAGGLGGSLAAGAGWLTGASTLGGSLTAGASLLGTGTAAGALSGLGMMAGALGPLALGAFAIMALSKKRGGPKQDGFFGVGVEQGGDNSLASSVRPVVQSMQQQFDQINRLLGNANSAQFGLRVSRDPQGTAPTIVSSGVMVNGQFVRQIHDANVGRDDADVEAAIDHQMKHSLLAALRASNLPTELARYLDGITDDSGIDEAIERVQKALTERQALEQRLFDLTHTEQERAIEARRRERDALDETNRALYDHVAALEDLTATATAAAAAVDVARGGLTDAYQREVERVQATAQAVTDARSAVQEAYRTEGDGLRDLAGRHRDFATQLRADAAALSGSLPQSRAQRLAAANRGFASTSTGAFAGDEAALGSLSGSGSELIEAARAMARSPREVAAVIARVQASLITAAAASEGRATVADQQLEQLTNQVQALGVLNGSVLTVSQAIEELTAAQTENAQAQQQLDALTQQLTALGVLNTSVLTVGQALSQYLQAISQNVAAQVALQIGSAGGGALNWDAPIDVGGATTLRAQYMAYVSNGGALSPLEWGMKWQAGTLSGFANGGLPQGVDLVGERGQEAVDFESPARVYTAEQTAGMFATNAELVPLLREVSEGIAAMRQELRAGDVASVTSLQKMESVLRRWENIGMPVERIPA